ncbi:outer membrane protein [Bradyrhizobium sp. JYMT SZCCT0180]|uniref:outer membrane protein n=1 Tax=Bradyrhizobium sp. JYMT SZCCT0180 TaxID=2807666 RepID=UPI001BA4980D|nr:outer membrane protein [Bradyrhizobium sp. JYMT SZCCT0180]MBR1212074.1 porin family protein [Bradyrhizobium sp. JYMT SZCCT0180]
MKRLLLGLVIAVATVASAQAADLAARPVKAPIAASVYSWTGFYIGGNFGYGVGHNSSEPFFGAPPTDRVTLAPRGVLGGLQIGYNWQAGNWVLGAEADWQWTDQRDSYCFNCISFPPGVIGRGVAQEMPWFGTVRGRLGYAAGPALFYATGGLAYGEIRQTLDCCFGAPTATATNSKTGWTAGGGVEAALAGNWTAKVEYLYVDLGSVSNTQIIPLAFGGGTQVATSDVRNHVGRVGVNYRFGAPPAPAAAPMFAKAPVLLAYNWTGAYVGGNVGYGVARNAGVQTFALPNDQLTISPDGVVGGAQAGYNWQSGSVVLGLEGDFQWSGQKDTICRLCQPTLGTLTQNFTQEMSWLATARGRLGYAAGPALFYVTGGAAFGEIKTTINQQSPPLNQTSQFNSTKTGWTVGGGIEAALGGNWSAKAEYLYVDLGNVTYTVTQPGFGPLTLATDVRDHVGRVGVNYKFGSGPVVAKY